MEVVGRVGGVGDAVDGQDADAGVAGRQGDRADADGAGGRGGEVAADLLAVDEDLEGADGRGRRGVQAQREVVAAGGVGPDEEGGRVAAAGAVVPVAEVVVGHVDGRGGRGREPDPGDLGRRAQEGQVGQAAVLGRGQGVVGLGQLGGPPLLGGGPAHEGPAQELGQVAAVGVPVEVVLADEGLHARVARGGQGVEPRLRAGRAADGRAPLVGDVLQPVGRGHGGEAGRGGDGGRLAGGQAVDGGVDGGVVRRAPVVGVAQAVEVGRGGPVVLLEPREVLDEILVAPLLPAQHGADDGVGRVGPVDGVEVGDDLGRAGQVAVLGPDPAVGRAVVVQVRAASGHLGLGRREVIGVGVVDAPPDLVGVLHVQLQPRLQAGVGDPADGVAVLDEGGELADVVVGGRARDVDPQVGVGRVGLGDDVLPGLADLAFIRVGLRGVRRQPPLRPLGGVEPVVRGLVAVGPVGTQRPDRAEGLDRVQEAVGEDLGGVGRVARHRQPDVGHPRAGRAGGVDGVAEVQDHQVRGVVGDEHVGPADVGRRVVGVVLDRQVLVPARRAHIRLALEAQVVGAAEVRGDRAGVGAVPGLVDPLVEQDDLGVAGRPARGVAAQRGPAGELLPVAGGLHHVDIFGRRVDPQGSRRHQAAGFQADHRRAECA